MNEINLLNKHRKLLYTVVVLLSLCVLIMCALLLNISNTRNQDTRTQHTAWIWSYVTKPVEGEDAFQILLAMRELLHTYVSDQMPASKRAEFVSLLSRVKRTRRCSATVNTIKDYNITYMYSSTNEVLRSGKAYMTLQDVKLINSEARSTAMQASLDNDSNLQREIAEALLVIGYNIGLHSNDDTRFSLVAQGMYFVSALSILRDLSIDRGDFSEAAVIQDQIDAVDKAYRERLRQLRG